MIKNLILLTVLAWVTTTYAKDPVAQESMGDAENFKVEKAVQEQDAQRGVAGDKLKKKKKFEESPSRDEKPVKGGQDSEVRYWQYQE